MNRFYQPAGGRSSAFRAAAAADSTRINVSTDWAAGSSGSAVLDECGNVIGHVSTISTPTSEGNSKAQPAQAAKPAPIVFHEAVERPGRVAAGQSRTIAHWYLHKSANARLRSISPSPPDAGRRRGPGRGGAFCWDSPLSSSPHSSLAGREGATVTSHVGAVQGLRGGSAADSPSSNGPRVRGTWAQPSDHYGVYGVCLRCAYGVSPMRVDPHGRYTVAPRHRHRGHAEAPPEPRERSTARPAVVVARK